MLRRFLQSTVVREIIPDNPEMLYRVAKKLPKSSPARREALDRADKLLANLSASDRRLLLIKAAVKYEKEEYADSLEQYQYCLDSNPNDYATHFIVATILEQMSDYENAVTKLDYIIRMAEKESLKTRSRQLKQKIEAKMAESRRSTN